MGIVYSTIALPAVRLAYICQQLFDPTYSCIEDAPTSSSSSKSAEVSPAAAAAAEPAQVQSSPAAKVDSTAPTLQPRESSLPPLAPKLLTAKSNSLPRYNRGSPENSNSLHQQNRNRRAQQLRFKTRPSSFDAALIIRAKTKNAVIVTSTPSPLNNQWDGTSSSGCSSDSGSNSDSDSETELRVSADVSNEEGGASAPRLQMTAEEEEAFRLTLGRGHFTRSKKDRFLNNLRMEKRLNDLNKEHFSLTCKSHLHLQRRHSGDLYRII